MATDGSLTGEIAGRYATALYDLADEAKALDGVAADLGTLRQAVRDIPDLAALLRSPMIERDAKASAMAAILKDAGASDLVRRFVGLVARNNRLIALPAMIDAFLAELRRRRGESTAEVVSARKLTDEQLATLTRTLQERVGGRVAIETRVDPGLIGGLVVRIGSRMIDASLKTKLERLKFAMKGAT
ncbi:MAG: F0F1 ATP synthase subunit delta [Alphaproteobacteria bacterium]